MPNNIKPVPDGYHTSTPMFTFRDSRKAMDFYKKAFGAKERMCAPFADGKGVMHGEFQVGDSIFMVADENPRMPCKSAETMRGSPVSFFLYVPDADVAFAKAVAAGCTVQMPMMDAFWGDRWGCVGDPFGHSWAIATHKRDVPQAEIAEAIKKACAEPAGKK